MKDKNHVKKTEKTTISEKFIQKNSLKKRIKKTCPENDQQI